MLERLWSLGETSNSQRTEKATFRLLSDAWFAIDIALNFRTGIITEGSNAEIILDAREIRRKYLRGWFALDILSTFPFDIAVSTITFKSYEQG